MLGRMMRKAAGALLVVGGLSACGHSEEEWKAQLAKYDALAKRAADDRAELEKQRQRVADLKRELEAMGVKLSAVDASAKATGDEKTKLAEALEEYKQRAEALERIKARFEALRQRLKKLTEQGLDVTIRNNRLVISLPGDVLFESGKAELRDAGRHVLDLVAEVIRSDNSLAARHYQVAGHTDNQPLQKNNVEFKDNWALSLMRAREVLIYLIAPLSKKGGGGLDTKRWSAAGYGAIDPVAANTTPAGRKQNRRVELVLLPDIEEMLDLKSLLQ